MQELARCTPPQALVIATETGHDVLEHCKKTSLAKQPSRHRTAATPQARLRTPEEYAVPGVLHVNPFHDEITHDGIPPRRGTPSVTCVWITTYKLGPPMSRHEKRHVPQLAGHCSDVLERKT